MISPSLTKYRLDIIQFIRGLAALSVCMLHGLTWVKGVDSSSILLDISAYGASGVDIFFCISGFVMAYTTQDSRQMVFSDFCVKRISRILPIYAVLTVAFVLIMKASFFFLNTYDPEYNFRLRDVVRSLLFIPLKLSSPTSAPFWGAATLGTGWTLNYEMYFYSIFAVSLLFGKLRWIFFFGWIFTTLTVIPWVWAGTVSLDTNYIYGWKVRYLNLMTNPMIWEFVGGVLAFFVYQSRIQFRTAEAAWVGVAVAVSFAMWMVSTTDEIFSLNHWGLAYFVLFSTVMLASKTITFHIHPSFLMLGRISFSLYLVHLIVQGWIGLIFTSFTYLDSLRQGLPFLVFLTMTCIAVSIPVHHWLEIRMSAYVREALERSMLKRSTPR